MASFSVQLCSHDTPLVIDCDAYAQESTMLTFFRYGSDCTTIDAWSNRVASFRIADVTSVIRSDEVRSDEVPVLVAC